MKRWSAFVSLAWSAVALTGCAVNTSLDRSELPPEWRQALPATAAGADVAGVYMVRGELLAERSLRRGSPPEPKWLFDLFFERAERPFDGVTIELRLPDPRHLEVIVTRKGGDIVRALAEVTVESEPGAVVVRGTQSERERFSQLPASVMAGNTVRLCKGTDGRLYARLTGFGAGFFTALPYYTRDERWARWEPATPERIASYAADEKTMRYLEQSMPLQVGDRLPRFAAVPDLQGTPLVRSDFEGRVVLVHFTATSVNDNAVQAAVKAAHQKYRARGLEIVTIWGDRASKRTDIEQAIARHALGWRHAQNPPGRSLRYGFTRREIPPPFVLILDREVRIAALNPPAGAIDGALAALLPDR